MADATRTTRFRFWLWLIAFIGVIAPRRLDADWRQEWEAELQWREQQLAEVDPLSLCEDDKFTTLRHQRIHFPRHLLPPC
jgi:hypothetical protein